MMKIIAFVAAIAFVAVTADKRCRDGWVFFRESCYYIGDAGLSYVGAEDACNNLDSNLATIAYEAENDFIKSQLQNVSDSATAAWFGYVFDDSSGDLRWYNKYSREQSFTNWPNDMEPYLVPKKSQGSRKRILCAALSKQLGWAWGAFGCGDTAGMKYVCEGCTIDQVCTSRACFRLDCKKTSKYSAETWCENLGGALASIRSREENNAVKDLLRQIKWNKYSWGEPGSGVWLAGSDSRYEGRWKWPSANGEDEVVFYETWGVTNTKTFADWQYREPNNNGGWSYDFENCMVMAPNDWRWNDVKCSDEHFALCEIPNVNAVTG